MKYRVMPLNQRQRSRIRDIHCEEFATDLVRNEGRIIEIHNHRAHTPTFELISTPTVKWHTERGDLGMWVVEDDDGLVLGTAIVPLVETMLPDNLFEL